jgi:hypothetical protein
MNNNTIAVVADCDDTLAPDTIHQLLKILGVDPIPFFSNDVPELIRDGFDPCLAYLHKLTLLTKDGGPLKDLKKDSIIDAGKKLSFYEGVPEIFGALKREFEEDKTYKDLGLRVKFFVVSSGLEELLLASKLNQPEIIDGIFGCSLAYDDEGKIVCLKRVISFTDKTRFLFLIQKGKTGEQFRNQPYIVNELMEQDERPVPFSNMIYLGDGPSDIPCMSLLQNQPINNRGYVIGILNRQKPVRSWALGYGRRANITVPQGFGKDSDGYYQLKEAIKYIAEDIKRRNTSKRPVPEF